MLLRVYKSIRRKNVEMNALSALREKASYKPVKSVQSVVALYRRRVQYHVEHRPVWSVFKIKLAHRIHKRGYARQILAVARAQILAYRLAGHSAVRTGARTLAVKQVIVHRKQPRAEYAAPAVFCAVYAFGKRRNNLLGDRIGMRQIVAEPLLWLLPRVKDFRFRASYFSKLR